MVILDPSIAMMRAGEQKGLEHITRLGGSGETLPLADNSVDTLT